MFELQTERLRLIPLDAEDYLLHIEEPEKLEEKLDLNRSGSVLDPMLKNAHKSRLKWVIASGTDFMWSTNWLIVWKEQNRSVGGIMIKGAPNDKGEVIIGYGTDDAYQNRGFMSETINGIAEWIFQNPYVRSIVADTDKTNIPSHRVLQKNGFVKFAETAHMEDDGSKEELVWWRLERK